MTKFAKKPYRTSRKRFPTAIVGLGSLDRALRHLHSVTFEYDDGDTEFTVTAHRHEYDSALRACQEAADWFDATH